MKTIRIPKGRGAYRTIYCPSPKEKAASRAWLPHLEAALETKPVLVRNCMHGFRRGRSAVTNARAHCDRQHTVCFDISSYFDSITEQQVAEAVKVGTSYPVGSTEGVPAMPWGRSLDEIVYDGAPRQGLPSSPAVANLVIAAIIADILAWVDTLHDASAVLTDYADDLTLSSNCQATIDAALVAIPEIVAKHGFKIAEHKTRVQHASAGRRIITGVAVDKEVHPTRKMKRKLRAAKHQKNLPQAAGLAEWCSAKLPRQYLSDLAKALEDLVRLLSSK